MKYIITCAPSTHFHIKICQKSERRGRDEHQRLRVAFLLYSLWLVYTETESKLVCSKSFPQLFAGARILSQGSSCLLLCSNSLSASYLEAESHTCRKGFGKLLGCLAEKDEKAPCLQILCGAPLNSFNICNYTSTCLN